MASTINPQTWLSLNLGNKSQERVFIQQLVQYLTNQASANAASFSTINAALADNTQNLGAFSTSPQTYNAQGSRFVSIEFTFSVALTLNITNLPTASAFLFTATNTAATARILTLNATTPAGAAYTSILVMASASQQNLLTGWSFGTGVTHFATGLTMAGPAINLVAQ